MKTPAELNYLAQRHNWRASKLSYAEVKAMTSDELRWHELNNSEALEKALNTENNKGLVEQAENRSKQEQLAETYQRSLRAGKWLDDDSPVAEAFTKAFRQFQANHPDIADTAVNGTLLGDWITQQHYDMTKLESFERSFVELGGLAAFELSPEAKAKREEQKMGAEEYGRLHGFSPYDDSRYYDALTGTVETRPRQSPHILARKQQVVDTFLESDEAIDYRSSDNNKHNMVEMLRAHSQDWTVQSLKWAWSMLKSKGIAELASPEEQAARKSSGQAVVLHNLGGRTSAYPTGTTNMPVPRRRRKISELSSAEYLERLRDKGFRALVDSGADSFDDD